MSRPSFNLSLDQQQAVKTYPESVNCRAYRHKRAIKSVAAREVQIDTAMVINPVPPADKAMFTVDQCVMFQIFGLFDGIFTFHEFGGAQRDNGLLRKGDRDNSSWIQLPVAVADINVNGFRNGLRNG